MKSERGTVHTCFLFYNFQRHIRARSDKYLASPPEGATIAREIYYRIVYYRIVYYRRGLLSKFQSNRTACENGHVRGFYKNEKKAISVGDSILVLKGKSRSEIKERLDAVHGDSFPSMATVKNWFKEFQRGRTSVRFLMS